MSLEEVNLCARRGKARGGHAKFGTCTCQLGNAAKEMNAAEELKQRECEIIARCAYDLVKIARHPEFFQTARDFCDALATIQTDPGKSQEGITELIRNIISLAEDKEQKA